MIPLHTETYKLPNGESCRCVANFESETVRVMARNFNEEYSMDDYNEFEGNMVEFAVSKIGCQGSNYGP